MKQYSFMRDEWDGSPKTIWSRKKQTKLIEIILQKYPRPIDLKNKLLDINNEESIDLGNYIDPTWSTKEYIRFIQNNVIKYSPIGKIILSELIGAGIGTLTYYLLKNKVDSGAVEPSKFEKDFFVKNADSTDPKIQTQVHDIGNRILAYHNQQFSPTSRKAIPLVGSLLAKGATSYGAYKLSDAFDKEEKI